ncbi:MAG: PSD1 and planctomycete cytochrome C domain-containing protein, partial [Planctomycetota bacterium]|nr:PSD1 and planctomycete cytochrome C domain-containing protein [Planctomycetota bacterium]
MAQIPSRSRCLQAVAVTLVSLTAGAVGAGDKSSQSGAVKTFDPAAVAFTVSKVQPLLAARCFECHGPDTDEPKGGLRLDSRAMILQGGDTGPAVVPGQPDQSLLIDAIHYGEFEMPPKSKLPEGEIAILMKWVEMGAPWPADDVTVATANPKEPFPLEQRKRDHWAWQPLKTPETPAIRAGAWPLDKLDHFILAALEAKDLEPASAADRRTLIRRAYLDVIGLPPTPDEVRKFLDDPQPTSKAFAKVVDQLLQSPRFGERWARHWLDLARYAETRGHEFDFPAPNSYHYRDYIIRALNEDVPYDQFLTEQLAGDLLEKPRLHPESGGNESILGTGFWFLGEWVHSPVYIRKDETDRFDNMIDTMARTFMGVTLGCARCHDHKFDAISAEDYYAMVGYLQSSQFRHVRYDSQPHNRRVAGQLDQLEREQQARMRQAVSELFKPGLDQVSQLLLATREVAGGDSLENIASRRKLNPDTLNGWINQVDRARDDPRHPLHIWTRLAAHSNENFGAVFKELAAQPSAPNTNSASLIVDYGNLQAGQWMQNGFTFGLRPVQPGEFQIGDLPGEVRVEVYGAARRNPIWDGLTVAPETQEMSDKGPTDFRDKPDWVQAGRTLRTPTFEVSDQGKVFLRVSGKANVYAAVTSHRMIKKPLHTSLLSKFDTKGKMQWVTNDLSRYKGLQAHLEITPVDGREFRLLAVTHNKPANPDPDPSLAVLTMRNRSASLSALADAYQRTLTEVAERLAEGSIATGPHPREHAILANWLMQNRQLMATRESVAERTVAAVAAGWKADRAEIAVRIKKESRIAPAMWEGDAQNEQLLIRGSWKNPGPEVPRRLLAALDGKQHPAPAVGSGRLELARQMVDQRQNPLTPRVAVNRVWHHLFGQGIVRSVDNLGVLGTPPTHPQLLDHLASQFVADGWSVKRLIRRLLLSQTYQMSSRPVNEVAERIDPTNQLLHRQRVRRLEGEAIRDSILAISGRLDLAMYGGSVPVHITRHMKARGL